MQNDIIYLTIANKYIEIPKYGDAKSRKLFFVLIIRLIAYLVNTKQISN